MWMRKIMAALLGLALLSTAAAPAMAAEKTALNSVTAKGAVLIEAQTGRILFEQDAHLELPMASTTKIMTALLTLEQENLDETFVVDPQAIRTEGTSMGLKEGDLVTLRALCCGMLLSSGNDAANAAAVRIAGSLEAFSEQMNERAQEIGMKNSHFVTPSGLDSEGHYSTAYDMALLAREALENEAFREICSQSKIAAEYGNPPYKRWMSNHNRLLTEYEGAFGVKTGFTKKSGRCLVSAAERDGVTLICVTLGDPNDWQDHTNLLDWGFSQLEKTTLSPGQRSYTLAVEGGEVNEVEVVPAGKAYASLSEEERTAIKTVVELPKFVFAPIEEGEQVGTVRYFLGDVLLFEQPLVAEERIEGIVEEKKSWFERLTDWVLGWF